MQKQKGGSFSRQLFGLVGEGLERVNAVIVVNVLVLTFFGIALADIVFGGFSMTMSTDNSFGFDPFGIFTKVFGKNLSLGWIMSVVLSGSLMLLAKTGVALWKGDAALSAKLEQRILGIVLLLVAGAISLVDLLIDITFVEPWVHAGSSPMNFSWITLKDASLLEKLFAAGIGLSSLCGEFCLVLILRFFKEYGWQPDKAGEEEHQPIYSPRRAGASVSD